jgi:hypothetical protein
MVNLSMPTRPAFPKGSVSSCVRALKSKYPGYSWARIESLGKSLLVTLGAVALPHRSLHSATYYRRTRCIPQELIARVAPTRTEGLNMRGIFSFPIEQYADALLQSWNLISINAFQNQDSRILAISYPTFLHQNQGDPKPRKER